MEIQKLKDICLTEITDGTHQTPTYSEYGYIFLSSKNVTTQKIDWDNVMFIPEKLHEELYKRVAPQIDDILLAKNGTTGVAAIVDRDIVFDIYVSLALIRPNTEIVMPRYLLYAINNPVVKGYFDSSLKGIGVPNLHLKNIRETPIKIYDLETQKAIVEKLDKVCELISLRKHQLEKLDELVKARFVEMFGEISDNSMNWDCFTIGKLISTIESGWSGNGKQREKHADEIAVLKVSAVTKGYFIPTECKVLDDQHNIKKYVYPQKGDILFSRANTKEMVGATVLIKKDYPDLILPDKLWKIRFCTDVNPIYMKHVLSTTTVRNAFSAASTGTSGSMYNVSMEKFKGVIIPVPPLSVQNEFAAFVERVDQQKQTVQQSLEKLELMKKALMQEYFG